MTEASTRQNSAAPASLSLNGKAAFITGGTKGIGKGIALAMAAAGADVVISGRDQASAQRVLAEVRALGTRAAFVPGDLHDDEVVGALVDTAIAEFGHLDILVNNAAIGPEKPALDITLDDWRELLKLDLEVPFRLAQSAARHFIPRGGGVIINISSIRGQGAAPDEAHYIAAKHGLNGLTKALAREWAGLGVRVNAIAPGLIFTEMTEHWQGDVLAQLVARYPVGRGGYPRDIGGVAVFLASEAGGFVHGQILAVDGGRTTG
jgi:2-deoxy-D-gluconate 3-dehydrogenase